MPNLRLVQGHRGAWLQAVGGCLGLSLRSPRVDPWGFAPLSPGHPSDQTSCDPVAGVDPPATRTAAEITLAGPRAARQPRRSRAGSKRGPADNPVEVSVCIANWNCRELLRECLKRERRTATPGLRGLATRVGILT